MNTSLLKLALIASFASLTACGQATLTAALPDDSMSENEAVLTESPTPLSHEEEAEVASLQEFALTQAQSNKVLAKYSHLDPKNQVPDALLEKAVLYFEANSRSIQNKRYLSVIDFSKSSTKKRLFIINMSTGSVWALHMAHGKGSDSNHDGVAERFSNSSGSNASSLGFYRAAETYSGKHGYSLRLDGLSSTNSNARARAVVVHGASYVQDANVKQGRSWGCPAVSSANRTEVINRIKGGSIIYAGLSGQR